MPTLDDLYEKIDEIRTEIDELEQMIGAYDSEDDEEPVEVTDVLEIAAERANARCVRGYNSAGRPIMMIYPEDSAPVKDRVQYTKGNQVNVGRGIVKSDGGGRFYSVAEEVKKNGVVVTTPLFIREQDGKIKV